MSRAIEDIESRLEDLEHLTGELRDHHTGLRDQFAMAALTGMLAHYGCSNQDRCAADMYRIADAMLKAREVGQLQPTPPTEEELAELGREEKGDG